MKIELQKKFCFEAAHALPRLPKYHKCYRLADTASKPHSTSAARPFTLDEIEGLKNPSSENTHHWIFGRVKPTLHLLHAGEMLKPATPVAFIKGTG